MRRLVRAGSSGAVLAALFLLGSVGLWVGVPLAWLWLASHIFVLSGSLGAALGAAMVGVVVSIGVVVQALSWLSRKHGDLREARGLPSHGPAALEAVLVVSAAFFLVAFLIWFFVLSGAQPIPVLWLRGRLKRLRRARLRSGGDGGAPAAPWPRVVRPTRA